MPPPQDVPDLPMAAKAALDKGFAKFTSTLHSVQRSTDGNTFKLLLSLQDGLKVEACVMQYVRAHPALDPTVCTLHIWPIE